MKNVKEEFGVEKTVFRIFLKHIKANKLYIPFRWAVNHEKANRDLIHIISSRLCDNKYYDGLNKIARIGGSFIGAHSIDDIARMLNADRGSKRVENNAQFQLAVMNMVNCLLHSCIEHAVIGGDMHVLEKLGSTIFEESCKELLGEDFKDMTEEAINPHQREMFDKMREMNGGMMPSIDMLRSKEFLKMIREQMRERRETREQMEMERPSIWHHPSFDCYQLDYNDDDEWI